MFEGSGPTALVALFAALVALLVGLATALINRRNAGLQAVISQQMKHAEFRQAWINRLREEMANLRSRLLTLDQPDAPGTKAGSGSKSPRERRAEFLASSTMVRLMMDRKDEDYGRMVELIDRFEAGSNASPAKGSPPAQDSDLLDFIEVCQDIIKREWEVTKADMHRLPADYASAQRRRRIER